MNSQHWLVKFKTCIITTAWQQRNNKHFLQIYFTWDYFARFCKFQKLLKEKKQKGLLEEGSNSGDVNEGKFVLIIDVLFAL